MTTTPYMTTEDRINKAKIRIVNGSPFFSYLCLYLEIEEDTKGRIPKDSGMSVNPRGNLKYRKDFVETISDDELMGVLCHEILHLALLHLTRGGKRNHLKWNISTDLVINTILLNEGYKLPKGIRPNSKNQFVILGKVIQEVDKKSAEEIYDEMPEIPSDKSPMIYVTFDQHETGGDGDEIELSEAEKQKLENEWYNRVQTASVWAQQKGELPAGLERYIEKIGRAEIDWRTRLLRFVQQLVPHDQTWMKRSKVGHALGIYLPSLVKERIDICVGIDTSGSIGQDELTKFLTEIISIARNFKDRINMRIFFHDVEIQGDYMIENGNIEKIMTMKIKGGGGTSHEYLFKKVRDDVRNCKCLISFTDGYSDIENIDLASYRFKKIFVINKNGRKPEVERGLAETIKLKENYV